MRVEIFTDDVKSYLINATGDTNVILQDFKDCIEARVKVTDIVVMASNWDIWNTFNKEEISLYHAGDFHASRFIVLMEYLSEKIKNNNV